MTRLQLLPLILFVCLLFIGLVTPTMGRAANDDEPYPWLLPAGVELVRQESDTSSVFADAPANLPSPVGVFGAQPLTKDDWEVSYRFYRENASGLIDGTEKVSDSDLFLEGYSEFPTKQKRERHVFSLTYGASDAFTFVIAVPWVDNQMRLENFTGDQVDTRAKGVGDLAFMGLYSLTRKDDRNLFLNLGVTLPTGSIDEKDQTTQSAGFDVKLPYAQQLGSGTLDLIPGLTWVRSGTKNSWGAQWLQTLRFGRNSEDYRLGDRTELTTWISRDFKHGLSASARVAFVYWGDITGQDDDLNPDENPANDPNAYGGKRLDVSLGATYDHPSGNVFAAEVGAPLFQNLNGPQLETDVGFTLGWQFSF